MELTDLPTSFDSIFDKITKELAERNMKNNIWFNADGSPKRNTPWREASNTEKGDSGEELVRQVLYSICKTLFGEVEIVIVNKGKGEYDIKMTIISTGESVTFEVKTATKDTKKSYQFNGIKKNIDYDFIFCLGVSPDNFYFKISSKQHICPKLTTLMSKNVPGCYKYSRHESKLIELTPINLFNELKVVGLI